MKKKAKNSDAPSSVVDKKSATHRDKKSGDVFAQREAKNYKKPIASREFILDLIHQQSAPLTFTQLIDLVALDTDDDEQFTALKRRLRAMVRDGQIIQNRRGAFGIAPEIELHQGRVSANAAGFGFLIPETGGEDLFLSPGQMKAVFDGDIVLAKVTGTDRRGRKEGRIEEIVTRNTHEVVGQCFFEGGVHYLRAENKKIHQDILIENFKEIAITAEQMVVVEITHYPNYRSPAKGKIIEVLGDHMAPGMEIDIAIRTHQLPFRWPEAVEQESAKIPKKIPASEIKKRVDLREKNFVTIDGEDARDFDDAIFCEKTSEGYCLLVAIADVGHYVSKESALDLEAYNRGNSVYFPKRVIPMLPESLSNGLCSLNPKQDRLTMVCQINLSSKGELLNYQFMEAVIHSKARLTYTEVAEFIDKDECSETLSPVKKDIQQFHELYQLLQQQRDTRGAINVETRESRFIFNEQKKIETVEPVVRNVAHQMIEEAMLLANICAANILNQYSLPALYRVHDHPSEEKINNLKEYLSPLGFRFSKGSDLSSASFQEIIHFSQGRLDQELINIMVLRSMQQAMYSSVCSEHFGLAYDEYAHFTSPIRRYADLVVHRALKYLVRSNVACKEVLRVASNKALTKKQSLIEDASVLNECAQHISFTERRADLAARDAVDFLKCEFMLDKVGENFSGKISTVTAFGIFVLLDDIFIEGLVHISDLTNDYYNYDETRHELVAEQSKHVYRLTDEINIQVARVSLEDKKIEFLIVDEHGQLLGTQEKSSRPKKGSYKSLKPSKHTKGSGKTKKMEGSKQEGEKNNTKNSKKPQDSKKTKDSKKSKDSKKRKTPSRAASTKAKKSKSQLDKTLGDKSLSKNKSGKPQSKRPKKSNAKA